MTSPGHKIGQILKLIYLRQYLSYSVDQKLKMSEISLCNPLTSTTNSFLRCESQGQCTKTSYGILIFHRVLTYYCWFFLYDSMNE